MGGDRGVSKAMKCQQGPLREGGGASESCGAGRGRGGGNDGK